MLPLTDMGFEFGKSELNGVEIRGVARQEFTHHSTERVISDWENQKTSNITTILQSFLS